MLKSIRNQIFFLALLIVHQISSYSQINPDCIGFFDYSVRQHTVDTSLKWKVQTKKYKPIDEKYPYTFFPKDFISNGGFSNYWNDELYFTYLNNLGTIKISKSDSVTFYCNNHLFKQIKKAIQKPGEKWILTNSNLYLSNENDTIEYSFIKYGQPEKIITIHDAKIGIWVETSNDLFHLNKKGGVRYLFDNKTTIEGMYPTSKKEIFAMKKDGLYKISSLGVEYINKDSSSNFRMFIKDINQCRFFFNYKNYLVFSNQYNKSFYFISEDKDYKVDLNFSKPIGIDSFGNIWYTSYNSLDESYYLNYIKEGWDSALSTGNIPALIPVSNFNAETGTKIDLDFSFPVMAKDNSIYFTGYYDGIIKYQNGKYFFLPGTDASKFKSVFDMLKLKKTEYVYKFQSSLWSKDILNKAVVTDKGFRLNFYQTDKDSQGDQWIVEKGELINSNKNIRFNIGKSLEAINIRPTEQYAMNSNILLNRVFINKFDVVHIFGKQSIVTYDIKSNKWANYAVEAIKGTDLSIDYQKIFEDKFGNIWFQVYEKGIFYLAKRLRKMPLELNHVEYWQIDKENNLIYIKNGYLYWYKIDNLENGQNKLITSFIINNDIYSLNRIHTIVQNKENLIIINTEGFYIFSI